MQWRTDIEPDGGSMGAVSFLVYCFHWTFVYLRTYLIMSIHISNVSNNLALRVLM